MNCDQIIYLGIFAIVAIYLYQNVLTPQTEGFTIPEWGNSNANAARNPAANANAQAANARAAAANANTVAANAAQRASNANVAAAAGICECCLFSFQNVRHGR